MIPMTYIPFDSTEDENEKQHAQPFEDEMTQNAAFHRGIQFCEDEIDLQRKKHEYLFFENKLP